MSDSILFWLIVMFSAAVHPVLLFSYYTLVAKRKDLIVTLSSLPAEGRSQISGSDRMKSLRKEELDFNWRAYMVPVAITSLLIAAGVAVLITKSGVKDPLGLPDKLTEYVRTLSHPAAVGFAGGVLAGLYGVIDRFRSLTLSALVLHLTWFRLVFATVVGGLVQEIFADQLAVPTAFGIALLPIRELLNGLRTIGRRVFDPKASEVIAEETLWKLLQGATPDIVDRLIEADVGSVQSLASQEPIALLRKTNIHWRTVIDLMDQAILVTYVGEAMDKLRKIGIRGAIEAAVLTDRLMARDKMAEATLAEMAKILEQDMESTRNLVVNLREDSQVNLLWDLWFRDNAL